MRSHHDNALATWQAECVDTGGYSQYGAIFNRNLSWEDKLAAMDSRTRRKFEEWTPAEKSSKPDKETNPKKAERAAARAKKIAEREKAKNSGPENQ